MTIIRNQRAGDLRLEVNSSVASPHEAYPHLCEISRPTVETAAAAYYLNRSPQTLRLWACKESGPLRPIRLHGRLHWSVDEICKLLAGV